MKSRLSAGDAKSAAPRKECFSRRSLRTFAIFAISALAVAFAAVSAQQPAPNAAWTIQLDEIVSPAAANTMEPQLTVEGSRTILSWLERNGPHTTLKFAERTAGGWSGARTAAQGDNFMVNASDVPSVRLLADGTLVAEWLQEDGADPESYKLKLSWSKDAGGTWSAPLSPHHDTAQAQHGFASLFQTPGAGVGLVWLDGREIKPDAPEGVGNMALRAAIFEADGTERPETVVDARVCECCPTAAAATSEGIVVAYRDRSANEIRDISIARLVNGRWTPPTPVHDDGWRINGCPVNGPAISARGREVAVAWFSAKGDQGHALVAFSHDAGRTFGSPVQVDEHSSLGRTGVELLIDGSAIVTSVDAAGERQVFTARRIDEKGKRGNAAIVGEAGGTRYPRVARSEGEVVFAWTATQNGATRVLTARARIP